jgi:PAS domain S-box-containing protein
VSSTSEPSAFHARYFQVFLESPEPIIVARSDGTVVEANPAFLGMFGYTSNEVVGRTSTELGMWRHPETRARLLERFQRDGRVSNAEAQLITKNGEVRTLLLSIHPTEFAEGRHVLWFGRDITNHRLVERQLRQSQKLESIGTLAGGIAHDFNNILAVIFGYNEMARSSGASQEVQKYLDEIMVGAKRARDLVKQILAFSRRSETVNHPIRVSTILKETVRLLQATLPATIDVSSSVKADGEVLGDPSQLHQVFMNLCTNAYQAMRTSGGKLAIRTERFERSQPQDRHSELTGPILAVEIADNGVGIAPSHVDRIFEPYFTTKEVNEGTGLGLSVVHGIVSDMGGTISVRSRPGAGTTFRIEFPIVEEQRAEDPGQGPERAGPTRNGRIMFVDDEAHIARVYTRLLMSHGFSVTSFTNGHAAFDAYRKAPDSFDVVVTDQTMPGLTGIQLAGKLQALRPDLPIILCTGYSEIVSPDSAEARGLFAYLLKPVSADELSATIRAALEPDRTSPDRDEPDGAE